MTATSTTPTTLAPAWIDRISAHDVPGAVALYAPDATFGFHIPSGDGVYSGAEGVAAAVDRFFIIDREDFRMWDVETVADLDSAAVRFTMSWIDANDGARCTCYQSHHFSLDGDRIARQEMFCAGVRAELS
jgi:hypothetical protein